MLNGDATHFKTKFTECLRQEISHLRVMSILVQYYSFYFFRNATAAVPYQGATGK